jgi:hypothetical protein
MNEPPYPLHRSIGVCAWWKFANLIHRRPQQSCDVAEIKGRLQYLEANARANPARNRHLGWLLACLVVHGYERKWHR